MHLDFNDQVTAAGCDSKLSKTCCAMDFGDTGVPATLLPDPWYSAQAAASSCKMHGMASWEGSGRGCTWILAGYDGP